MRNDLLRKNISYSALQAVVALGVTFFVYRLLIIHAGLEILGLWSLLTAGAVATRLADFSGASGLARFVAEERAANRNPRVHVHTVILTFVVFNGLLASILFLASGALISNFVDQQNQSMARRLVPLAIIQISILMPIVGALSAGVDGLQRSDIRAKFTIVSYILFFGIGAALIPPLGIWGFFLAQATQQILLMVVSWAVLMRYIPSLGLLPYRWSASVFRQTAAYGLKLQAHSLAGMLSDPLAKALISQWGGLSSLALFEVASRLVLGLRSMLVQAAIPILPAFAGQNSIDDVKKLLRKAVRMSCLAAVSIFLFIVMISPIYSYIMLDRFSLELLIYIFILTFGYAVNTASVPYNLLGSAKNVLVWNILSQVLMAASIIIVGFLLGPDGGSLGVVIGMSFGLVLGALVTWRGNSGVLVERG